MCAHTHTSTLSLSTRVCLSPFPLSLYGAYLLCLALRVLSSPPTLCALPVLLSLYSLFLYTHALYTLLRHTTSLTQLLCLVFPLLLSAASATLHEYSNGDQVEDVSIGKALSQTKSAIRSLLLLLPAPQTEPERLQAKEGLAGDEMDNGRQGASALTAAACCFSSSSTVAHRAVISG
jgi:hypothetical protein